MTDLNIVSRLEKLWRSGVIDVEIVKELLNKHCQFVDISAEILRLEKLIEIATPPSEN